MSIIHEALKKSNPQQGPDTDKSAARPEVELHRRPSSGRWGPLFILFVCFLAAGPVLVPMLFKSPLASRQEPAPAAQFAIEEAPLPASPVRTPAPKAFRSGKFVLSGIVYSAEDSYCLINGLVLRRGDRVGDAVVEAIAPGSVTLALNGKKLELTA